MRTTETIQYTTQYNYKNVILLDNYLRAFKSPCNIKQLITFIKENTNGIFLPNI